MKKRFNKSVALILVLSFLVLWGCAPQQKPLPEEVYDRVKQIWNEKGHRPL